MKRGVGDLRRESGYLQGNCDVLNLRLYRNSRARNPEESDSGTCSRDADSAARFRMAHVERQPWQQGRLHATVAGVFPEGGQIATPPPPPRPSRKL